MWIEDTDIEKCSFEPFSPKTIGGNVEARAILSVQVALERTFPDIGCNSDLMQTSLHT